MIDALTTNHTAFLREPDHFEFLRREVLPELASREICRNLERGLFDGRRGLDPRLPAERCLGRRARSQIVASDISMRALRFAERGVYPDRPLRRIAGSVAARVFRAGRPSPRPAIAYRAGDAGAGDFPPHQSGGAAARGRGVFR